MMYLTLKLKIGDITYEMLIDWVSLPLAWVVPSNRTLQFLNDLKMFIQVLHLEKHSNDGWKQ